MARHNSAMTDVARIVRSIVAVLPLLLVGCAGGESDFARNFPGGFVSRARSHFESDITSWDISAAGELPNRIRLVVSAESAVKSDVRSFCELRLLQNLKARRFELAADAPARLFVLVVRASEIRKPVRAAKIRLAALVSTGEGSGPLLLGIVDGMALRPELGSGTALPNSSYLEAVQQAVGRLVQQLSSMPRMRQ